MEQRDVHLFVLDTLADWEPGLAVAHLNHPAPGVPSRYRVRTVGIEGNRCGHWAASPSRRIWH